MASSVLFAATSVAGLRSLAAQVKQQRVCVRSSLDSLETNVSDMSVNGNFSTFSALICVFSFARLSFLSFLDSGYSCFCWLLGDFKGLIGDFFGCRF